MKTISSILVGIFTSVSCGEGNMGGATIAPLMFSPNPSVAKGGVCSTTASLADQSGINTWLVSAEVTWKNSQGQTTHHVLDSFESQTIPAYGVVQMVLHFDVASIGLSLPVEGTVIVIGQSTAGLEQFVGSIACEG